MSKDSLEQFFGIPLPAEMTQAGCDFVHEVIRRNRVYVQQVQGMAMYQGLIDAAVETADPSRQEVMTLVEFPQACSVEFPSLRGVSL